MDLSAADYAHLLRLLLPRGAIWQAKPGSVQAAILEAFAQEFARVDGRVTDLLAESLPETTVELLDQWEAEFGLPESCDTREGLSIAERQARLAAKVYYRAIRGAQRWHALAASYGATVELATYQPTVAGSAVAGDTLVGHRGRFQWLVIVLTPAVVSTDIPPVGELVAGDALGTYPKLPVECAFRQRNPAHMTLSVGYTED